jgi:uncharacterized repeat protein (TIGR01451 family)
MRGTFRQRSLFRASSYGFRVFGLIALGFLSLVSPAAWAVTGGTLSLSRTLDKTVAVTNSPILVMSTLTNNSPDTLRGFYYFDEVPSGLKTTTVSVTLNGRVLTNSSLESGLDGDVYAGCTPRRWWLENPTNFVEANSLPPQSVVQILYSISSTSTGTFNLQQFGCAACGPDKTNSLYGYSGTADQQTVTFTDVVRSPPAPPYITSLRCSNDLAVLTWTSSAGGGYRVQYVDGPTETNWTGLQPDITANGPSATATYAKGLSPRRFYRVLLLTP